MSLADVMDSCMHARVVQQFKINIPLLLHRLIKSSAYIAIGFLRNQTYPICNLKILVLNNYRICGQDGHDGEITAEHTAVVKCMRMLVNLTPNLQQLEVNLVTIPVWLSHTVPWR